MSCTMRRMPGQYGSNGLRADGSSFNVGNKLGERPSIRLFSHYNRGSAMDALLSQREQEEERVEAEEPPRSPVVEAPRPRARTQLDIEWGQQRLVEAFKANRGRDVRAAVEDGADLNKGDDKGWTPLHLAAHSGKPRLCDLLIELGSVSSPCALCAAGSAAPRTLSSLPSRTRPTLRLAQDVSARTLAGETAADLASDTELAQHLRVKLL